MEANVFVVTMGDEGSKETIVGVYDSLFKALWKVLEEAADKGKDSDYFLYEFGLNCCDGELRFSARLPD